MSDINIMDEHHKAAAAYSEYAKNGKGHMPRRVLDRQKYRDNWDAAFGKKLRIKKGQRNA